jgi:hypothetical protein
MLNEAQGEGISATGLSHRVAWRSDRRVLSTRLIDARLIDHESLHPGFPTTMPDIKSTAWPMIPPYPKRPSLEARRATLLLPDV